MVRVRGVVLAKSEPAKELRVKRCINSLHEEIRLRGSKRCSGVFVVVTSTRTLASGFSGPRGVERGVVRMTLSCLSTKLSPTGSALFIRSRVPRLARLAFFCSGLIAMSELREGPAMGGRVGLEGFRTDVPINFFGCPVDRTTSVATFGTAAIPIKRSRLPVVRRAERVIEGFGSVCSRILIRPSILLPRGRTYYELPNASNKRGVDGSLNGYVCLTSARTSIGGGVVDVCASPARVRVSSPKRIRNGAMFACLSTFSGPKRFRRCLPRCTGLRRLGSRCAENNLNSIGVGGFLGGVVRRRLSPVHTEETRCRGSVPTMCRVLEGNDRATERTTTRAVTRIGHTVEVGCFRSTRLVGDRDRGCTRGWCLLFRERCIDSIGVFYNVVYIVGTAKERRNRILRSE